METRRERVKKASRRRAKDSSWAVELKKPQEEENNRKFFYIAAGAIVVALVAFLCGVQMGKSLSERRWSNEPESSVQDRKGRASPFRVVERGKEVPSSQKDRAPSPTPGERSKEGTGDTSSSTPEVPTEKTSRPGKESAPEEERTDLPRAKYSLQVAAFNNSGEAQGMVDQLRKKGYDAYQVTGSAAAKGTLHRVRIGHFQSLQEARQYALAFEKKENIKPIISSVQNP